MFSSPKIPPISDALPSEALRDHYVRTFERNEQRKVFASKKLQNPELREFAKAMFLAAEGADKFDFNITLDHIMAVADLLNPSE